MYITLDSFVFQWMLWAELLLSDRVCAFVTPLCLSLWDDRLKKLVQLYRSISTCCFKALFTGDHGSCAYMWCIDMVKSWASASNDGLLPGHPSPMPRVSTMPVSNTITGRLHLKRLLDAITRQKEGLVTFSRDPLRGRRKAVEVTSPGMQNKHPSSARTRRYYIRTASAPEYTRSLIATASCLTSQLVRLHLKPK